MRLLSLLALVACDPATDNTSAEPPTEYAVADCAPNVEVFRDRVWTPVLEPTCLACHGPGGIGSDGSRLDLDPADLEASMLATFQVADDLLRKPTEQHPDGHGGGAVLTEDSAGFAALEFWVAWMGGDCEELPPAPSCEEEEAGRVLRRLTHAEYDRTVEDLVGITWDAGATFASDRVVDGYHNDAKALTVSSLLADQYRASAEEVAAAADLAALLPCTSADGDCAAAFIESFGFRAFRRPLTQGDVDRYGALWAAVSASDGFDEGVRWVIAAMLQSPHFLYRAELGVQDGSGVFALTGWELATALSYDLWGTTPDAALLARAAAGELDDPEGLAEVAAEMLDDPRTLQTAADLVEVWLDTSQLQTVSRDGLDGPLRDALRQETRDLVIDLAGQGGTLDDLMTARHTFVEPSLAAHYGLEGSGRVPLDGVRYGGLLTQGSVLATHGRPLGSGPVQRGVAVRERLLCEDLPPPPANLDTSPPEIDPSASTRDQYTEHSANPECAGCHDKIDPLGFGFEHYDQLGRWRADDRGHAVDDSGSVDGVAFAGPFELADVLLDDPRFRACFVKTWRRHATGSEACADDPGPAVGLLTPLVELPGRRAFRERHGDPSEGDTLATGRRIVPEPPDGGTVTVPTGLLLELTTASDWGTGYCADGLVENHTADPVVWQLRTTPEGTIDSLWNAVLDDSGAEWVFSGVDWNREVPPGGTASFGYCASR